MIDAGREWSLQKGSTEDEVINFAFFTDKALRYEVKFREESFEPTWKNCCVFVALFLV